MIPQWTTHLKDPEEIKRFRQHIHNSKGVLDRLTTLMKNNEEALSSAETDPSSYESPSWAALQAHRNGYRQCLKELYKLTNLDPKEK